MAGIRLAHNVILDNGYHAWLAEDPGSLVRDSGDHPGAIVVVGPPGASKSALARARRVARLLARAGGPAAAAAGVDLGNQFRSARLEGAGGSRRNDVMAALSVLGAPGAERLGDRRGVMVALFGPSVTKRLGAAAWEAAAAARWSALRLAVAAGDLLTPARLEGLLALESPPGAEVVPPCDVDDLARNLASLIAGYSQQRRSALLSSLWDDVANWNIATRTLRRGRARRRRFSTERSTECHEAMRRMEDSWWSFKVDTSRLSVGEMLRWTPSTQQWSATLEWVRSECMAATVLLLIALDAEDEPLQAAITARLEALMFLHRKGMYLGPDGPCRRIYIIADAAIKASDPAILGNRIYVDGKPVDRREMSEFFGPLFDDACEMALATLRWAESLLSALRQSGTRPWAASMVEWRALTGWIRPPDQWHVSLLDRSRSLADRIASEPGRTPSEIEEADDLLWLADLADVLAVWHGHGQARVQRGATPWFDCTPPAPRDPDPFSPRHESVPLAVAGAAQMVSLGIIPPRRPKSWRSIVDGLAAQVSAMSSTFDVAEDVDALDGTDVAGTNLRLQVARTPGQLVEWGNYMGNCIASYAREVNENFSLVALLAPSKKIHANVALRRKGEVWIVDEAFARFNDPIPPYLDIALRRWAAGIAPVAASPDTSVPDALADVAPPPRPRRPDSPRVRLHAAGEALASHLGAPFEQPGVVWASDILGGIAEQVGWRGRGSPVGLYEALERAPRPYLAAAVGQWLGPTALLCELWLATSIRPLGAAIASVAASDAAAGTYLRRLGEAEVPRSLRTVLRRREVAAARTIGLASQRLRLALGDLLRDDDERLALAVTTHAHTGFLASAVLAVSAWAAERLDVETQPIPVASDGAVSGRPRAILSQPDGPWQLARSSAGEMGAPAHLVDQALAGAPGAALLAPASWLDATPWPRLWGRAHRATRSLPSW